MVIWPSVLAEPETSARALRAVAVFVVSAADVLGTACCLRALGTRRASLGSALLRFRMRRLGRLGRLSLGLRARLCLLGHALAKAIPVPAKRLAPRAVHAGWSVPHWPSERAGDRAVGPKCRTARCRPAWPRTARGNSSAAPRSARKRGAGVCPPPTRTTRCTAWPRLLRGAPRAPAPR